MKFVSSVQHGLKPVAINSNIYRRSDYRVNFEAEILDIDTKLSVGFKSVYLF